MIYNRPKLYIIKSNHKTFRLSLIPLFEDLQSSQTIKYALCDQQTESPNRPCKHLNNRFFMSQKSILLT